MGEGAVRGQLGGEDGLILGCKINTLINKKYKYQLWVPYHEVGLTLKCKKWLVASITFVPLVHGSILQVGHYCVIESVAEQ